MRLYHFIIMPALCGSSTALLTFGVIGLLNFSHSGGCVVVFHYSFNLHFLLAYDVECLFACLLPICIFLYEMSVQLSCLICLSGCSSFYCQLYIQVWRSQKQSSLSLVRSEVMGEEEVVCSWPGARQPVLRDRAARTLPLSTGWWVKTSFPRIPQETPSQGSSEMGDRWGVVTHEGGWSCQREPNAENQKTGSPETPPANLESFLFGLTLTFLIASWRLALLRRAAEESWNA